MAVVTESEEEVDASTVNDAEDDVGGEVEKVEGETFKEVLEEAAVHMKMGLTCQILPCRLGRTFKQEKEKYNRVCTMLF